MNIGFSNYVQHPSHTSLSPFILTLQEVAIEVDENGTLDLSMKKTKREDIQSAETACSLPSSSQLVDATLSQDHPQSDWDGPLDFTKPSEDKEEDHEEVMNFSTDRTFWDKTKAQGKEEISVSRACSNCICIKTILKLETDFD